MSTQRFHAYRNGEIEQTGEIPVDWDEKPLWALASCNDEVLTEATPKDYLMRYIEISDVDPIKGIVGSTDVEFGIAPSRARRKVRNGDVIVSTVRTYLRAIAAIREPSDNMVVSTGFAVMRPREVHPIFLEYLFRSEFLISEIISRSVGVSYPAINASEIGRLRVPVPPAAEQAAIATFLDRETGKIDALAAEQERLISLLQEKRQAVISQAVTKGLNPDAPMKPSGVEWLGEVPAHWQTGCLSRIASRVVVGIAEAAVHAYADQGIPILRSTNVRPDAIVGDLLYLSPDYAAERGTKMIEAGDLITVRTGHAGVTAVIPPELDGCQCFTMLITTLNEGHVSEFFSAWLNSYGCREHFGIEAWGSAQPNISVPILKAVPVPIPPVAEQRNIVDFIKCRCDQIDDLIDEAARAVALLKERRAALISAAVTGKIDVRNMVRPAPDLLAAE